MIHNFPDIPPHVWPSLELPDMGQVRKLKRRGIPAKVYVLVEEVRELQGVGDTDDCYKKVSTFQAEFGWKDWYTFKRTEADAVVLGLLWTHDRTGRTTVRRVAHPLPTDEELKRWARFLDWAHRTLDWTKASEDRDEVVRLRQDGLTPEEIQGRMS